ncbi:MAG: SAM-dependent methyltransferase [Firmicutes bacterium]|nr:SAM-dependent methyltransferase [Bacillota bacterium]
MNRLSDRLQLIANRINEGETMADIGTDHGFLPIYLKVCGKSPRVIMADVSGPSLEKGRKNAYMMVRDMSMLDDIDFRVGDGLMVLDHGEVDAVVIAGMGGKLIRDIMAADFELTKTIKKFIMQPRIGQGHLRKWLIDNDFVIIFEDVVIEGDYIPEVITAVSPGFASCAEDMTCALIDDIPDDADGDSLFWKIPPWIVKAGGPVGDFLDKNIWMEEDKLNNVKKAKIRNLELENSISEGVSYLKRLRKEWEDGK